MDRDEIEEEEEEGRFLIEMHPNLPEGYVCVLAPTIGDAANRTTVPVYLFNPHSYPVLLGKILWWVKWNQWVW